jgi:transposase
MGGKGKEIYTVEPSRKVRLACAAGMNKSAAARDINILRETVDKVMVFCVPPGHRRTAPIKRPKLDGFTVIIDAWLDRDRAVRPKQRHTSKRVYDRLHGEQGFTGGYTIIKDYA